MRSKPLCLPGQQTSIHKGKILPSSFFPFSFILIIYDKVIQNIMANKSSKAHPFSYEAIISFLISFLCSSQYMNYLVIVAFYVTCVNNSDLKYVSDPTSKLKIFKWPCVCNSQLIYCTFDILNVQYINILPFASA